MIHILFFLVTLIKQLCRVTCKYLTDARIIKTNNYYCGFTSWNLQTGGVTITTTLKSVKRNMNASTITDTNVSGAMSFTCQWTRDG